MENLYQTVWPIIAILAGIYVFIFRENLIKQNVRAFSWLYKMTKINFFKVQSENYDSTYMRMVTVLVGVIFVSLGCFLSLEQRRF
jgi:hypothetical protein